MHTPGIEPKTCTSKASFFTICAGMSIVIIMKQMKHNANNVPRLQNTQKLKRASHMLPRHRLLHWHVALGKTLLPTDICA